METFRYSSTAGSSVPIELGLEVLIENLKISEDRDFPLKRWKLFVSQVLGLKYKLEQVMKRACTLDKHYETEKKNVESWKKFAKEVFGLTKDEKGTIGDILDKKTPQMTEVEIERSTMLNFIAKVKGKFTAAALAGGGGADKWQEEREHLLHEDH